MNSLSYYIERAQKGAGVSSDRQLCAALKFKANSVSHWRTGRAWPSEDHMISLCELAGIDPAVGLLDLASWRANEKTSAVWRDIARRIASAAAVMLVCVGMQMGSASPARASVETCNRTLCDKGRRRRERRRIFPRQFNLALNAAA